MRFSSVLANCEEYFLAQSLEQKSPEAYFEGSSEKEFKDDFHGFIKDFIENGDINEIDKSAINELLIDDIERLALNGVKEVRNDKNVNSAIAHLDRRPLYQL